MMMIPKEFTAALTRLINRTGIDAKMGMSDRFLAEMLAQTLRQTRTVQDLIREEAKRPRFRLPPKR